MPKLFSYIMWALVIYFMIRIILLSQKNGKTKGLIEVIRFVDDENQFNDRIIALEDQFRDKNVEFFQKTQVLKLWGAANHGRTTSFSSVLEKLQPEKLIQHNKGTSIAENEDSFFYLYISIPNILYGQNQLELMEELFQKLSSISEQLSSEMVVQLGLQAKKYYQGQEDFGKSFYQSILEGDYETLTYSKNMISVYKSVCSSLLAKIAQEENDIEGLKAQMETVNHFNTLGVGQRFLNHLSFQMPKEEVKEESSEETMNETMGMEKLTDPQDENKK